MAKTKKKITIEAGPLRKVYMFTPPLPRDTEKARRAKSKITSEAQRKRNHKTAAEHLEEILYCNFVPHDLFVTLTYAPGQEPSTRKEAKANIKKYIRILRMERKRRGLPFLYVYNTESKHNEGRYHHHLVINATGPNDLETIISLWQYGEPAQQDVQRLAEGETSGRTFYDIAQYMTKEYETKSPLDNGSQIWSGSRNLARPAKPQIEWIDENESITIPPEARSIEKHETQNEYGIFIYLKYIMPMPPQEPGAPLYRPPERESRGR